MPWSGGAKKQNNHKWLGDWPNCEADDLTFNIETRGGHTTTVTAKLCICKCLTYLT